MQILNLIIIVGILLNIYSCDIAAGSYPYAERFELDADEAKVISAIEQFRLKNPEFSPPSKYNLPNGRHKYWYVVYFYFPDDKIIIYSWVRQAYEPTTTLALYSINYGNGYRNWLAINHDLEDEENDKYISKFENIIVRGIKKELEKIE